MTRFTKDALGALAIFATGLGVVGLTVAAMSDTSCAPVTSFPAGADYAHGVWTVNGVTYAYSSSEDSLAYRHLSCL